MVFRTNGDRMDLSVKLTQVLSAVIAITSRRTLVHTLIAVFDFSQAIRNGCARGETVIRQQVHTCRPLGDLMTLRARDGRGALLDVFDARQTDGVETR